MSVPAYVSRPSVYDIAVHIDRIYRVCDSDTVVSTQDIAEVSGIAFRSVADKDFGLVEIDASRLVVVADYGVSQEIVTLFRPVAFECGGIGHFIHGLVHGLDTYFREWPGDIPYP